MEHEILARIRMREVGEVLGIPNELLRGSEMQVEASLKPDERVYIDGYHDGLTWELLRQHRVLIDGERAPHRREFGYIHLGRDALNWLLEQRKDTIEHNVLTWYIVTRDFGELAGYTFRTLHPAPHHRVVATYEATLAESYDKYWAIVNRLEAEDEGEDAQSSPEMG